MQYRAHVSETLSGSAIFPAEHDQRDEAHGGEHEQADQDQDQEHQDHAQPSPSASRFTISVSIPYASGVRPWSATKIQSTKAAMAVSALGAPS